ncbi:glycosyltransferase family 1 protein [Seonamhaeicola marinus]|uniref:Glycosyltransferase family 1 protein n=2 Tax=Seonamhaeicola marinus TaxID=1912246 RepID=A0A5D0HNS6_9FLAO|nr:glycosyltransferase family 1 protein [Seonamhaeicola marinus]
MNLGGAETMIMNYYRNIDRTKLQFDFLLHREEKGHFDDEIIALGGKIYRMPAISPKNYFNYKKALNDFFDEHPEYKIVHSHLNALSSIILGIAKKKYVPVRIAHSHLAVEPFALKKIFKKNTDIKATIKDSIQSLIKGGVPKSASHYFSCGIKAGDWLFGKKNRDKVLVINNAIDSSKFTFSSFLSKKKKEELGITGKKVIGHVGRFNEQKNHFFLVNIFNEILKKDKNCILVLVGSGNLQPSIEEEAKRLKIYESIKFLGLRTDIPEILQSFDLFLFPSLYEGLPVTLIEAQACGLRIVTTNTVTSEVDITNLITFKSLEDSYEDWAYTVLERINYTRENTNHLIEKGGYDIFENARNLQTFYLNYYI